MRATDFTTDSGFVQPIPGGSSPVKTPVKTRESAMSTFNMSTATKEMMESQKTIKEIVAAGGMTEAEGKDAMELITKHWREEVGGATRLAQITGTNKELKRQKGFTHPDMGDTHATKMPKTEPNTWGDFSLQEAVETYNDIETARAAVAGAAGGIFGPDFNLAGRSKGHPKGSSTAARGYVNWEYENAEGAKAFVEVREIKGGSEKSFGIYEVSLMNHLHCSM